ncbi:hypothetical protein C8R48DRAFT_677673 [Suillus tomentosus]|nr:hypothetical protein C8R48DRAFT_677673 [Suillus tomentosus]
MNCEMRNKLQLLSLYVQNLPETIPLILILIMTTQKLKTPYKPLVKWRDMESTILGKRSAEDLPPAGQMPPPPEARTVDSDSDSLAEEFDDGADWLDAPAALSEFRTAEKDSFVLAASSVGKQPLQSGSAPTKKAAKTLSPSVPDPSAWDEWKFQIDRTLMADIGRSYLQGSGCNAPVVPGSTGASIVLIGSQLVSKAPQLTSSDDLKVFLDQHPYAPLRNDYPEAKNAQQWPIPDLMQIPICSSSFLLNHHNLLFPLDLIVTRHTGPAQCRFPRRCISLTEPHVSRYKTFSEFSFSANENKYKINAVELKRPQRRTSTVTQLRAHLHDQTFVVRSNRLPHHPCYFRRRFHSHEAEGTSASSCIHSVPKPIPVRPSTNASLPNRFMGFRLGRSVLDRALSTSKISR